MRLALFFFYKLYYNLFYYVNIYSLSSAFDIVDFLRSDVKTTPRNGGSIFLNLQTCSIIH